MSAPAARVLVVEDQAPVRGLVVEVMRDEGHAVDAVETGEEALRRLERELYDVVLLDLALPGIGGMEVLSAARTLQTDAQFVMMTGHGSVASAVEAVRLGAFDYLSKPVDVDVAPDMPLLQKPVSPDALARRVREVLDAAPAGALP